MYGKNPSSHSIVIDTVNPIRNCAAILLIPSILSMQPCLVKGSPYTYIITHCIRRQNMLKDMLKDMLANIFSSCIVKVANYFLWFRFVKRLALIKCKALIFICLSGKYISRAVLFQIIKYILHLKALSSGSVCKGEKNQCINLPVCFMVLLYKPGNFYA